MPSSVPLATATTVMPKFLCRVFIAMREYPTILNDFPSGESIRGTLATNWRRSWKLGPRLGITDIVALRTFYDTTGAQPFHFYEPIVPFTWDATGVDGTNRYTVRFEGNWKQTQDIVLGDVDLTIIEIAGTLPDAEVLNFQNSQSSGLLGLI